MNRRELLLVILKGWLIAIPTYGVLLLKDSENSNPDAELAETVAMAGLWSKDDGVWIPDNPANVIVATFIDPAGARDGVRFVYESNQKTRADGYDLAVASFRAICKNRKEPFTDEEEARIMAKLQESFCR